MRRVPARETAAKAARAVVRDHLGSAARAASRLADAGDVEALHDCRVAIRRLRVALKAYQRLLSPGVPKALRKALRALARHSGPARDAEVFVDWLAPRLRRLRGPAREVGEWLLAEVTRRRDADYRRLRTLIPKALGMVGPLLRAGLAAGGRRRAGVVPDLGFDQFTAMCVDAQVREFMAALATVRGAGDHARVHRARIAAKKVRYLLEAALTRRGRSVLKPFRRIQDLLGHYHDRGEVRLQIARSRKWRRPRAAAPRPGLVAIAAIADREERALFARIQRDLLRPAPPCLIPVRRWVRRHAPPPAEPRARRRRARKY